MNTDRVKDTVNQILQHDNQVPPNIQYKVTINLIRQTRLIEVCVDCKSPLAAATIANAYGEVFTGEVQNIIRVQNVQIIDNAKVPTSPVRLHVLLNTLIAAILAGGGVYGIFVLLFMFDNTMSTPADVTKRLDLPVVGTILFDKRLADKNRQGNAILATGASSKSRFQISESFCAMQVNLQYAGIAVEPGSATVLMLTSNPYRPKKNRLSRPILPPRLRKSAKKCG